MLKKFLVMSLSLSSLRSLICHYELKKKLVADMLINLWSDLLLHVMGS